VVIAAQKSQFTSEAPKEKLGYCSEQGKCAFLLVFLREVVIAAQMSFEPIFVFHYCFS